MRKFIAAEIRSVGQLEVLLLLRGATDKGWTVDEIARALVMLPSAAAGWLEELAEAGLVERSHLAYRYAPPTEAVERTIDRLAGSYVTYRRAVIGLIFTKPSDALTEFPEAFRLRRHDD